MLRSLLMLALCVPGISYALMVWGAPDDGGGMRHGAHGRPVRGMQLVDGVAAVTQLWLPTLERRELIVTDGMVAIKPSGLDNYHLLHAVRETTGLHETALRYHYFNGKPSNRSPEELVEANKAPLEIIPKPLAREHARYTSESMAVFEVRYQGQALAGQPISLETTNGTRWFTTTDERGRITFSLPADFAHIRKGREANPPADFVLSTRYSDNGREYRSTLSAPYHVNPRHWQSLASGGWAMFTGFVSGLIILGMAGRGNVALTNKG